MKYLTDEIEIEIREVLSKYYYWMINKANKYKGELTILNETDIDNILHDMKLNEYLRPKVISYEDGKVTVEYPNNVCIMHSREPIKQS